MIVLTEACRHGEALKPPRRGTGAGAGGPGAGGAGTVLALAVAQVVLPDPDPQVVVIPQWIRSHADEECRSSGKTASSLDARERKASIGSAWAPISAEPAGLTSAEGLSLLNSDREN